MKEYDNVYAAGCQTVKSPTRTSRTQTNNLRTRRADTQIEDISSQGSARTPSPDPTTASQLQAKLAALYGDVLEQPCPESTNGPSSTTVPEIQPVQPSDESSYAFRLFSSAAGAGTAKAATTSTEVAHDIQQVVISSPSPAPDGANGGGFISSRNLGYYMTSDSPHWNTARRAQFADPSVTISGSWVAAQSQLRNRGLELPWRSRTIKVSIKCIGLLNHMEPSGTVCVLDSEGRVKKVKPNKKRRIMLRERQRKKEADTLQKQRRQEDKERGEREKKTRRNREKKVKKKEKMKAKKAQVDPAGNIAQAVKQ